MLEISSPNSHGSNPILFGVQVENYTYTTCVWHSLKKQAYFTHCFKNRTGPTDPISLTGNREPVGSGKTPQNRVKTGKLVKNWG